MATNISQDEDKQRAITQWKNKSEAAKKGEVLREVQKLKVQIQAMEREKCTHIYSKRSDFRHDFSQLEELDSKQTSERKTEQIKLKQQLEKISHMVKRFHKELRDVKPTPEFVEKLKVIMEDIEATINSFKEQQRKQYEEILLEERTTWLEVQALEKKFDSWSQINTSDTSLSRRPANKPLASARDITKDLPPEVAAFEKFLEQNGGVRGGWDEYDHQTFLKFRQRYQGKPVFLHHLLPALPTRTEEETRAHEEWYQEYLFLNETKKEAIKKWREKKEEEKEELLAKAAEEEEVDVEADKQERLKQQMEAERHQRKTHLNAYKVQKELEKAHKEEKKLREQLETHKKKQEWKQRQEELRSRVLEHKRRRQEEEELIKQQQAEEEEEEKMRQQVVSARERARFRERDETALRHKLAKEKAKEQESMEKERRLERLKSQVDIEVERDPRRLLQPTAGWKNRAKDKSSSGGQILHMPHRAVPAWRQGP